MCLIAVVGNYSPSLHKACDSFSILSAAKNTSPITSIASEEYLNMLPKPQSQFAVMDSDQFQLLYNFWNTTPVPVSCSCDASTSGVKMFKLFSALSLSVEHGSDLPCVAVPGSSARC